MDEQLLIRFLNHRCTPTEIRELDEWIAKDKANADWLFEMETVWSLKDELRFSDKQRIETAYIRFVNGLPNKGGTSKRSRHIRLYPMLKYAAIVTILVLVGLNLYQWVGKDPVGINVVEVPKGQRVHLTLSDGTKVWLNSHSRFTYPTTFSPESRQVELEGEGFFEVAHNQEQPFVVNSELIGVKVLGTRFNMKVYRGEPSYVTLSEGKVEVVANNDENEITLKPNEQVGYSKESGWVWMKNIDTSAIHSWTKGEVAFMNKRLDEIIKDLERKFNVNIQMEDTLLAAEIFTCHFKETITIEQVLILMKETRKIDYSMIDSQIRMYKPKRSKPMETY